MKPIIICGSSCTGKTTVADLVARRLGLPPETSRPSAGALFRRIAEMQGMTMAELRAKANADTSIDILIDQRMLDYVRRHEPVVLDSRVLAWLAHRARLASHRVLLTVSPATAAARFAKREHCNLQAALDHISSRDREDVERLGRLHGWKPDEESCYDMVFDSETHEPSIIANYIVNATK